MQRILIVEDDIKTVKAISSGLRECGFFVDYATNGLDGLQLLHRNYYDVIVTDVLMPGIDGVEFCNEVRRQEISTPIIIISALGLTENKLKGFEAGGDDYLVKPFDFEELLARINVLLRRSKEFGIPVKLDRYADLTINRATKEVIRNGIHIQLTSKEFHLLEYFMKHKGELLTKEDIIANVWGFDFDTGTNILEVYISYLRNKMDNDNNRKLIHTRKGIGYIFEARYSL